MATTHHYQSDHQLLTQLLNLIDSNIDLPKVQTAFANQNLASIMRHPNRDQDLHLSKPVQTALPLIRELYYRTNQEVLPETKQIDTLQKIEAYLKAFFHNLDHEKMVVVLINDICQVIDVKTMWEGTQTECTISIREIANWAVENQAIGVFIAHNHPNGTEPSEQDVKVANQLSQALKLLEIQLMDSVVVTDNQYHSMAHLNLIP